MWGELQAGQIPVCWLTLTLRLYCRTLGKHFIVSVGFSRPACVNPTLDFMAWAQRSRTVRPLLARELSLCDYKPPLIQALFFCGVAGERLMGWKKTLAQRYGSRSPRCLCLLELSVLRLLSPLLALTFVIGPVVLITDVQCLFAENKLVLDPESGSKAFLINRLVKSKKV